MVRNMVLHDHVSSPFVGLPWCLYLSRGCKDISLDSRTLGTRTSEFKVTLFICPEPRVPASSYTLEFLFIYFFICRLSFLSTQGPNVVALAVVLNYFPVQDLKALYAEQIHNSGRDSTNLKSLSIGTQGLVLFSFGGMNIGFGIRKT